MKDVICKAVNSKDYNNSQSPILIEMIFDDLLLLLDFVHHEKKEGLLSEPFFFNNQLDYLDSIWHHFILHTQFYYEFCMKEFGDYLHHQPEEKPGGHIPIHRNMKEETHQQIKALENTLGSDFVNRIYFLYPELLGVNAC